MEVETLLKLAKRLFDARKDCAMELIDTYNELDIMDRKQALARFVREYYLGDENPDPFAAQQFLAWFQEGGAATATPLGIFEIGERDGEDWDHYRIENPKGVFQWALSNLAEGYYLAEPEKPPVNGVQHFRIWLSPEDRNVFALRWKGVSVAPDFVR